MPPADTAGAAVLPGLADMLAEMEDAPAIVQPSLFWEDLVARNLDQLAEGGGFENFKRTLSRNYFQFMPTDPRHEQFRTVMRRFAERPRPAVLGARPVDAEAFRLPNMAPWRVKAAAQGYAFYVAMLWEWVRDHEPFGALDELEEPQLGSPVAIRHRGRLISEDLCNSVLELAAILSAIPGGTPGGRGVIELGAGSGRLAWAFLSLRPGVRYVIVDIPPALAVSQEYLTRLFPDRPTFRFRRFEEPDEALLAELHGAELAFLTPNQLELLPPLEAGLFVNISSFHEMRPEQIAHYFGQVATHCRGHLYSKQWRNWTNPLDQVHIDHDDYPIPADWDVVFDRTHPIQPRFFEALYRLPAAR